MEPDGVGEIKLLLKRLDKVFDLVKLNVQEALLELDNLDGLDEVEVRSIKLALSEVFGRSEDIYNTLVRMLIVLKSHKRDDSHESLKRELDINGGVEDHVKVFSDGSCLGNPGPGGWAALIIDEYGWEKVLSGGELHSTNNRMELTAVIEALKRIDKDKKVIVYTDSKYIRDAFEDGHIERWIANGWKTSSKKDVANRELWEVLYDLVKSFRTIKFVWVEGHSRGGFISEKNNKVDLEARRRANEMKAMAKGLEKNLC